MAARDRIRAIEVGDGAGELQRAVKAARRERQTLGRLADQRRPGGVERGSFSITLAGALALVVEPATPSFS